MLSIIIPTYNERENMEPLLKRLDAVRSNLQDPMEILVVDGGSQDGTVACAQHYLADRSLGRVIAISDRPSLVAAVGEGIRQARGEVIGVMDADLSHPPELLPTLIRAVRAGAQVAVASRYVPGGGVANWPWSRRLLSCAGNLLARPLVPVADARSGYFVCRAELVKQRPLEVHGFKVLLQLLVQRRVQEVNEVPYLFTPTPGRHGRQPVEEWRGDPQGIRGSHGRQSVVWGFTDRIRSTSKLGSRTLWCYLRQVARLYYDRWLRPQVS